MRKALAVLTVAAALAGLSSAAFADNEVPPNGGPVVSNPDPRPGPYPTGGGTRMQPSSQTSTTTGH